MILCSECHTRIGEPHFFNIVCQAICEMCKRECLGYETIAPALPDFTGNYENTGDLKTV